MRTQNFIRPLTRGVIYLVQNKEQIKKLNKKTLRWLTKVIICQRSYADNKNNYKKTKG
jgi:hypothetical protein